MAYSFSGEKRSFELGGGLGAAIGASEGLLAMTLNGVIGYRYQRKKDVIFRAGFTPFISIPFGKDAKFLIVPLFGISLGYSI